MASRWTDLGTAVLPGTKSPSVAAAEETEESDSSSAMDDSENEAEPESSVPPQDSALTNGSPSKDATQTKTQTAELAAPAERDLKSKNDAGSPLKNLPVISPTPKEPKTPPLKAAATNGERANADLSTAPLTPIFKNVHFAPNISAMPKSPQKARVLGLQERLLSETTNTFMAYEMKIAALEAEIKSLKTVNFDLESHIQKMVDDTRGDLENCEFELGEISDKLRIFPRTLKRIRLQ